MRTKDGVALLLDAIEQRLQPAHVGFDVRVEEDDHVAGGITAAEVLGGD